MVLKVKVGGLLLNLSEDLVLRLSISLAFKTTVIEQMDPGLSSGPFSLNSNKTFFIASSYTLCS